MREAGDEAADSDSFKQRLNIIFSFRYVYSEDAVSCFVKVTEFELRVIKKTSFLCCSSSCAADFKRAIQGDAAEAETWFL